MINKERFCIKMNGELCSWGFCKTPELIENYDKAIADETQVWHCHHRLETHFSDGTERPKEAQLSAQELIALNIYFDRPPEELIFLTHKEHLGLHKKENKYSLDKNHSEETKKKISESVKSSYSEEHKRKISESNKGKVSNRKDVILSEETKKKMSESHKGLNKGKHWKIENGKRKWYII